MAYYVARRLHQNSLDISYAEMKKCRRIVEAEALESSIILPKMARHRSEFYKAEMIILLSPSDYII